MDVNRALNMPLAAVDSDRSRAHLADPVSAHTARPIDVTVIIVSYKSAKLTIEALRSLVAERATPGLRLRAVVVDNASGDMPEIARALDLFDWTSWVTLVLAPINGGFAYGNNLGIVHAYASGAPSYVFLLNPDTQARPGAIGSLVRFLEANPNVGIAGCSFESADGSDWPFAFRFPTLVSELTQGLDFGLITRLLRSRTTLRSMTRSEEQVDWISGAAVMIRPKVLETIGGLDENYFLCFEETDFCRRARSAGFATWYVPESRVMHIGGFSTNPNNLRMPSHWFESRRRYFAVTFGIPRAMAIDVVAVVAHLLGSLKRIVQLRRHTAVPYYIRDLVRHSVIWRGNRNIPPARSRIPPTSRTTPQ
jgi:N-acetylglucosaminyl-diphospho-decaprenol L-rhamnosyltransferase